jgi:hypothetical protein
VRLRFAPEQMEMYQELEAQKAEKVTALYTAGIISKAEAREMMGLTP